MSVGAPGGPATSPTTMGGPPGTSISRAPTPWRSRTARVASAPSASASRRALIVGDASVGAELLHELVEAPVDPRVHVLPGRLGRRGRSCRCLLSGSEPRAHIESHQLPHRHAQEQGHRAEEALDHERPPRLGVGEELALAREVHDGVARVHVGHDRVVAGDERHQHRDERVEAEPLGDGHGDEGDDRRRRHPGHEEVEHEGDDRDGQDEAVGVPDHRRHAALHHRGQPGVDVERREHVAEAQDHPAVDEEPERPAALEGRLVERAEREQEQEGGQGEPRRRDPVVRAAGEADDQEDQHHRAPDLVPGEGAEERLLEPHRLEVDPSRPVRLEEEEQRRGT